ncbi:MAG: TetR/AcrR family transcriptional regulator [Spirochaetia bacterium]
MSKMRKQEIIECSLKILLEQGVGSLTIKNIAKEIGFVESAVYRHFSSKNEIMQNMLMYLEKECTKVLGAVKSSESEPFEKIRVYFSEWNKAYQEKPYLIPVFFSKELFKADGEFAAGLQNLLNEQNIVLSRIVKEGQEDGSFQKDLNSEHLRLIMVSPVILLVDSWFYSGMSFPLQPATDGVLDTVEKVVTG